LEELVNEEKYEEFYYRHHGGWGYGQGSQLYAPLDQVLYSRYLKVVHALCNVDKICLGGSSL
jgi:hypothetical protein